MGQKHLHELLKEDQEPFHLKTFIADRRSQLKSTTTTGGANTPHVIRKRKPIIEPFCIHHICLFSAQDSPGFKNSPFLDFPASVQKRKPDSSQVKFGLLGSFLRRLKDRSSRTKGREIEPATRQSVDGGGDEKRLSYTCNNSRRSSGDWSEKLSALETSCSSRSVVEFGEEIECLCSNPSSPLRFSLQRSPSPTRRKPNCSSAASPSGHCQQDKEICEVGCGEDRPNDDDKEQCSPVSVLDTFDEDEEERDSGAVEEDGYDIECSYANVQRAKHQLLQKLQRFERLAGLDPIELETYMLDQHDFNEEEDVIETKDEVTNEERFREIMSHLGIGKIPWYMKKLVLDLIDEEKKNDEHRVIVQRVCKRLHLWKVVDLNTIDMMVETDFRSEEWKGCEKESIKDMGIEIEMAIFGFLVDELVQEFVY